MGYYMRFIVSDERPIALDDIRTAFVAAGIEYEVDGEDNEATIAYQGEAIGQVTLNVPGDGLFDEERDELVEFAQDGDESTKGRGRVIDTLRAARAIVAVQVLSGEEDPDRTPERLHPLWTWLQANRRGLLQADGEGYYDGERLILALE